jgi:DNA repair exonuclease SbcCD ATPase subunit
MTFVIKNIVARNFLSIGNVSQAINFNKNELTLVLGENIDLGGSENKNGVGKTALVNALCYAFFGQALTNIKKDNLINRTNGKGMLVTVDFEVKGTPYRIERGRKPGVLTLYRGEVAFTAKDNDAQGDSRETQTEIEKIINMSIDMFRHTVALNTYNEPFLAMNANDQRNFIEQLLGITMLSEKAELLKDQIKKSKETITEEEYRIKAIIEANKKIDESLNSLRYRQTVWEKKHNDDVAQLSSLLNDLLKIDIDDELKSHENNTQQIENEKTLAELTSLHKHVLSNINRETKDIEKITKELLELSSHKCHACGQTLHGEKQQELVSKKTMLLEEKVNTKNNEEKSLAEYITAIEEVKKWIVPKSTTFYSTLSEAINHRSLIEKTQHLLEEKIATVSPYTEQIHEMETKSIVEIDYNKINETVKLKEHQEFLLKLLTNKDSFIRKRIIDQNLSYLNSRLSFYLEKLGLPHTVIFQNDLSVEITELGRDLSFFNLSRGEMTRVILSLSWAFRDVYESLVQPINLMFIDEMIDSGMDTSGVENAMGVLKKMARDFKKSIWLISHKDELTSRVNNVMKVVKSGGFTSYSDLSNE